MANPVPHAPPAMPLPDNPVGHDIIEIELEPEEDEFPIVDEEDEDEFFDAHSNLDWAEEGEDASPVDAEEEVQEIFYDCLDLEEGDEEHASDLQSPAVAPTPRRRWCPCVVQ